MLLVALAQGAGSEGPAGAVPARTPRRLGGIAIRPAPPADGFAFEGGVAGDAIRASVFLGDGPKDEALTYRILAKTGRIARSAIAPPPTGVEIPIVDDALDWLVVWRGLDGGRSTTVSVHGRTEEASVLLPRRRADGGLVLVHALPLGYRPR